VDRSEPASDRSWGPPSPGGAFSALVGLGARATLPSRVRATAYRAFARAVGANLGEAELALDAYPSLGDFFARRLRPGLRPVDPAPDAIVAPCDGVLAARGDAVDGSLVQAKGRTFQLAHLLARADDDALVARLTGGAYATIYLSPRDYHRVHAPVSGRLVAYDYVPGALWPVNPRVVARRDALFARNERVVITLDAGALGMVAVVMVAATGVGNLWLNHGPQGAFGTTPWRTIGEPRRIELDGLSVGRGEELGAFRLGSTVILVFERNRASLGGAIGAAVRIGERLGTTVATAGRAAGEPGARPGGAR
jgi:phosphatidylserine decarboxylase